MLTNPRKEAGGAPLLSCLASFPPFRERMSSKEQGWDKHRRDWGEAESKGASLTRMWQAGPPLGRLIQGPAESLTGGCGGVFGDLREENPLPALCTLESGLTVVYV